MAEEQGQQDAGRAPGQGAAQGAGHGASVLHPVRCTQTMSDGTVVQSAVAARVLVNERSAGLVSTASDYVRDEVAQGPILADLLRDRGR